jgi:hypothetical protein
MKYDSTVRWRTIAVVPVLLAIVATTVMVRPSLADKPKASTPTIACNGSTQTSINILVTAGSTGAPYGFSLHWMTAADFAANGFTWSSNASSYCGASFGGNANDSRYNLAAGDSVSVNVGELLFDNGTSTDPGCDQPLVCETEYVFQAFAHGGQTLNRSDDTPTLSCSTLRCFHDVGGCTYTQGYWKTHGPVPTGNNEYVWPQSVKDNGLTLGTVNYTAAQLLQILNKPAAGNGILTLAHQLIAAKINIANGASTTPGVDNAIINADALIGNKVIPPVGTGYLKPSATGALTTTLGQYNEGFIGPGHCD